MRNSKKKVASKKATPAAKKAAKKKATKKVVKPKPTFNEPKDLKMFVEMMDTSKTKQKTLENILYVHLSGDSRKELRQSIMNFIRNEFTPVKDCGITLMEPVLREYFKFPVEVSAVAGPQKIVSVANEEVAGPASPGETLPPPAAEELKIDQHMTDTLKVADTFEKFKSVFNECQEKGLSIVTLKGTVMNPDFTCDDNLEKPTITYNGKKYIYLYLVKRYFVVANLS